MNFIKILYSLKGLKKKSKIVFSVCVTGYGRLDLSAPLPDEFQRIYQALSETYSVSFKLLPLTRGVRTGSLVLRICSHYYHYYYYY